VDKETFNKARVLESRIFQLTLVHRYLSHFLQNSPFSVELKTSVFDVKTVQPIPFISGKHETMIHQLDKSDADFILSHIESRIKELETEFDNL
jgi:hypothetical protein